MSNLHHMDNYGDEGNGVSSRMDARHNHARFLVPLDPAGLYAFQRLYHSEERWETWSGLAEAGGEQDLSCVQVEMPTLGLLVSCSS